MSSFNLSLFDWEEVSTVIAWIGRARLRVAPKGPGKTLSLELYDPDSVKRCGKYGTEFLFGFGFVLGETKGF